MIQFAPGRNLIKSIQVILRARARAFCLVYLLARLSPALLHVVCRREEGGTGCCFLFKLMYAAYIYLNLKRTIPMEGSMNGNLNHRSVNVFGALGLLVTDRVFAAVEQRGKVSRQEGVTLVQIGLGAPSFVRLQEVLGLTQSAASRLVDKLTGKGLVLKTPRLDDPRGKLLRLTRKGEELRQTILADRASALQEMLAPFDSKEISLLLELVSKIFRASSTSPGGQEAAALACRLCDWAHCPQGSCPARGIKQDVVPASFEEAPASSGPKRLPAHLL